MPDGVRTLGSDDLDKISHALKEAADKDLQKQVSKAMRDIAKPFGKRVVQKGAAELPHRGGLAAYVEGKGRIGVSASLLGKTASVTLILRNKGVRFAAMDKGNLRHPVHGRPGLTRKEWTWVGQSLRPGMFRRPFEEGAPEVRKQVLEAAQDVLNDVAHKV